MHAEGIDHHKNDADQRCEQNINRGIQQPLDIRSDFLQFAERFSAALVFEHGVGKLERVPDAVGINLGSHSLRNDVQVVVLKVLGYTRDKGNADRR